MESWQNPSGAEIRALLEQSRLIAVVGLSDNPARPSHRVTAYLQAAGYRILPVNPLLAAVLGEAAYPDLDSLPGPVDIVCIFRRSAEVPPLVEAALRLGCRAIWMQDHVVHPEAARRAREAGKLVVMNDCILRRHLSLIGPPDSAPESTGAAGHPKA